MTLPDVDLRRATPADAPAMAAAHLDSIHSIGPAFYSPELVEAWAAAVSPEMYVKAYVRGSAARHGVGSALWRMAEAHAREQGATAITIEASLAGLAFYRAHGFVEIERCDVPLRNGAAIPCVVMRKDLTGVAAAR